jgi:ABC-type uncharacterized transport system ATPase subunit
VQLHTPRDAAALGIQTVYQDLALADNLDIVQNMFLGRERTREGLLDEDSMEESATETLAGLSVTTVRSIRQPVASLSGGQRQAVAIARAVLWNSKLVIMDEPTAALGVPQTKMVLDLVRGLADRGYAVLPAALPPGRLNEHGAARRAGRSAGRSNHRRHHHRRRSGPCRPGRRHRRSARRRRGLAR